jgi:tRNA-Thr(GGU) m(6)t(6)A37 methyltransferase TsaA
MTEPGREAPRPLHDHSAAQAELVVRPIGIIRTPFQSMEGTPIQPVFGGGTEAQAILEPIFEEALRDIEGFERVWLVYWIDRAGPFSAEVVPYRDDRSRGLFATRAPSRPNPLGISVVRLIGREGCVLRLADVDVLDGTPLLDIKPYVPAFDAFPDARAGWLDEPGTRRTVADSRFGRASGADQPNNDPKQGE